MTQFPVVSALMRIVDSVFGVKPTRESVTSDLPDCSDKFEVAAPLPIIMAQIALDSIGENLNKVDNRERRVIALLSCTDSREFCLRTFRAQFDSVSQRYDVLLARNRSAQPIARHEILSLRRRLLELDVQIDKLQAEGVAKSLQTCAPRPFAQMQLLVLLDAIRENDSKMIVQILSQANREVQPGKNPNDKEILGRFSSSFLRLLAKKQLVEEMSIAEYDACRQRAEELEKLRLESQRAEIRELKNKLSKQIFRGDSYYFCVPTYHNLLKSMASLSENADIGVLSAKEIQKHLIGSLYRGHLELFCGLGIIERRGYGEVSQMEREGLCERGEFFRIDKSYWRIPPTGIEQLKNAIRVRLA